MFDYIRYILKTKKKNKNVEEEVVDEPLDEELIEWFSKAMKKPEKQEDNMAEYLANYHKLIHNDEDYEYVPYYEEFDKSHDKYPISQYDAFEIAYKDDNLKNDYFKRDKRNITNIEFKNCDITLKEIEENPFWHIRITDGEVSWIEGSKYQEDCDGVFDEKDLEKLQCLVNAKTGEYKYLNKPIK